MSTQPTSPEAWIPTDSFGHRLLLLRTEKKMTAEEIADLCGIPRPTWLSWEKGVRPRGFEEKVQDIADATGADRYWLAFGGPLAPKGRGPKGGGKLLRLDSNQEPPGFRVGRHRRSGDRRSLTAPRVAA